VKGLYAIVDPAHCAGRDAREVASAILRGGCAALQLRDKRLDDAAFLALGHELRALCLQHAVPFFVNDRVALVAALGADGAHVGQGDLSIEAARELLGSHALLSVSTHDLAQAANAQARGADAIGFGPVFTTQTKTHADPVVGPELLREVCLQARVPVIAIGGITLHNALEITGAGARIGAAIAAVCAAPDVEAAARSLHNALGG
jgi:thiamine-phosphate pyrophosphorylase